MPKTVTVSGVGDVEFPDSMSDREIARAKRDLIATTLRAAGGSATGGNTKPEESVTAGDVAKSIGSGAWSFAKGVASLGLEQPNDSTPDAEADIIAARAATDESDTPAQAVLRAAVPIVGAPAADVLGPAAAVSKGRPPTKEENLRAVESGTALAAIAAAPVVGKRVAAMLRVRGAVVPAEATVAAPQEAAGATPAPEGTTAAAAPEAAPGAISVQNAKAQAAIDKANAKGQAAIETAGLPKILDPEFGAALRTLHTGERDVRIAEANNLAGDIRKAVPNHVDREALTLMRDFRNNPAQLQIFLDGTDPAYDGMPGNEKSVVLDQMQKLRPAMESALNPSEAMQAADAALTGYFGKTLQEGKDLGFLGSNIAPEDYVNHLLLPADAEAGAGPKIGPSGVNRYTPFAKGRYYPTVLDAVANGAKIRTLDVADALSIYGDKHGTAAATHVLIDTLKAGDIGKFATDSTAPKGWSEVGPGTRLFRNEVPYVDAEGNPQVAHQALYAPKEIADALRPLTDPDYSSTIPGFTATKAYQQYVKSVELGLSVFHMRALNLSAFGNEGLTGLIKSYGADMASPEFRDVESTLLKHGGTTSITGRTFEAYRAARETSLPTRLDVIRNLPVFKQFDQAAAATSHLTFDVLQRKFKVTDFGIKDAKWITEHPEATPSELAKARRGIAKEINAVYGGLNWEALGVNKLTRSMSKALFLAPDWTFSNWQTAKTAFEGGPGGSAARAFWLRSAVTGVALTQLTSLLMSGKKSDDPTQVYLGEDHHGNDIYQNIYFAGAPSDMIGLIKNVNDYGAFEGTAHSVAAKLAPITRTGVQILSNRNYLGHEIAKRGGGFEGDIRVGAHIATQLLPVPFSASNLAQMEASNVASGQHDVSSSTIKAISGMLGDPTKDYTPTEFLTTTLAGTKPRHIPQGSTLRRIRGW
jgi:hypothetical protein